LGPAFPHVFLFEFPHFDKAADFGRFDIRAFGFRIHGADQHTKRPHDTNRHEKETLNW
jgi:hypothetical protein